MLLTNGAVAREPWRISSILGKSAPAASDLGGLENSVITAYRANSALTKLHAVKQRGEKVRHKSPPPQADFEILSTWLTGKLLTK
jgi:hypothetical protein